MRAGVDQATDSRPPTVWIACGLTMASTAMMLAGGMWVLVDHYVNHGPGPGQTQYFEDTDVFLGGVLLVGAVIAGVMAVLIGLRGRSARVAVTVLAVPAVALTRFLVFGMPGVPIVVALALVAACVLVWVSVQRSGDTPRTAWVACGLTLVAMAIMLAVGIYTLVGHYMLYRSTPGHIVDDVSIRGALIVLGGLIAGAMAALAGRRGRLARIVFTVLAVAALLLTRSLLWYSEAPPAIVVALALVAACVLVWLPARRPRSSTAE